MASYLPPELICIIFQHLDGKSFINCRQVCIQWQNIADVLAKKNDIWKRYCKEDFKDIYMQHVDKSSISWYHMYRNICSWPKINKAWENQKTIYDAHVLGDVRNVSVSQDGVISIVLSDAIKFYDLKTNSILSSMTLAGKYNDYKENNYAKVVYSYNNDDCLYITQKYKIDENCPDDVVIDNVTIFSLVGAICYYVKDKKCLYRRDLTKKRPKDLFLYSTYNSDITLMSFCHDDVYMFCKCLTVVHFKQSTLQINALFQLDHLDDSAYLLNVGSYYIYGKHNILLSNDASLFVKFREGNEILYYNFPRVTAALNHGNVLILGLITGQILVFDLRCHAGWNLESAIVKYHMLAEIALPIERLDVHELETGQRIIAATKERVVMLEFDHFTEKKLARYWTEKTLMHSLTQDTETIFAEY